MSYEINDDLYPATAVCFIESTWGNQTYIGTGFIVGQNNDVLTAAHVIYDGHFGRVADSIKVYPSYDPDDFNNVFYRPNKVEYFPNFDPNNDGYLLAGDFRFLSQAGSELDIALLSMDTNLADTYGSFGIDWNFSSGAVEVIGHPGGYGTQPMYDSGFASKNIVDNFISISNLEINPGNSGGPVFYQDSTGVYAVGIVSTGSWLTAMEGHRYWLENALSSNDLNQTNVPSHSVRALQNSVNEGETASFQVSTNLPAGSIFDYSISGLQVDDILSNSLVGQSVVGSDGTSTINISLLNDNKTEGTEQLNLTVNNVTSSILVNDTSYAINYENIRFELTPGQTQNSPEGRWYFCSIYYSGESDTVVDYSISGLSPQDFQERKWYFDDHDITELTGNLKLYSASSFPGEEGSFYSDEGHYLEKMGSEIEHTVTLHFAGDNITEGDETFSIRIGNKEISGVLLDTTNEDRLEVNGDEDTNILYGGVGNDIFHPQGGDDIVRGLNGDDRIHNSQGDDLIYAGNGLDVYFIDWWHDKYGTWDIENIEPGVFRLSHINAGGNSRGTDILHDVERIEFGINGNITMNIALDIDAGETAGQAYRLYQAAFARTPDMPGVAYHMNDMESNGLSITQVAANFIASPEFKTQYGENPTEEEYINLLYQNVLGRTPQEFEVDYYKDRFEQGTTDWETTLVFFAESPENISLVAPQIESGIWMPV
ncbi:MAG: DUF4214 domain-containing protein [Burkholderiaceae bacterium]|nr:MAG: DUF4214 domain-containing protein [Burkholderiaceae bacterium]